MSARFTDRMLIEHELSATTTTIATLQAELRKLESRAPDRATADATSTHATEARAELLARLAACVRARDERFVALASLQHDARSDQ